MNVCQAFTSTLGGDSGISIEDVVIQPYTLTHYNKRIHVGVIHDLFNNYLQDQPSLSSEISATSR